MEYAEQMWEGDLKFEAFLSIYCVSGSTDAHVGAAKLATSQVRRTKLNVAVLSMEEKDLQVKMPPERALGQIDMDVENLDRPGMFSVDILAVHHDLADRILQLA